MLQNVLKELGVDCILINSPTNTFYFAGYNNPECVLVMYEDTAVYYTDARYTAEARAVIPATFELKDVRCTDFDTITADIAAKGVRKVGVEMDYLVESSFAALSDRLPNVRFVNCSEALARCRTKKTEREMSFIRAAAKANDVAFDNLLGQVKEGMTELEIAYLLQYEYIKAGGEGIAFDTICVFGDHTAYPHGHPGHRKLAKGDMVTLDFGTKVGGYCSDITRNFCLGDPGEEYKTVFNHVLTANKMGIEAGFEGVSAQYLDKVARDYLTSVGLGQYFTHSLGHGVGIDIHEVPFLNTKTKDIIAKGMTYTVEPGVYINGKFGVRIEDLLYMGDQPEVLSRCNKNLIIL